MFKRILMPLDGSLIAEKAIPYGEEFAKRLGSELILMHVCGPEHHQLEHMHRMYLEGWAETIINNIKKGRGGNKEATVKIITELGEPSESICNNVMKNNVDMIIMTQAGTSGFKVAMLGSVADHVCRTVPIPILLVRPQYEHSVIGEKRLISNILLPLDGSEISELALPVVRDLAVELHAQVTLFTMASKGYPQASADSKGGIGVIDYTELSKKEVQANSERLGSIVNILKGIGVEANSYVNSGTDAANEIIEAGKITDADIIIMSTHGRSGISRWVFGSTAEKVLRHGDLPLILINARAT